MRARRAVHLTRHVYLTFVAEADSKMPILSDADLEFFQQNGYVVARHAISAEQAALTASEVWEFSGMDPDDPESWYGDSWRDGPYKEGKIMVEMYHGQHQWANRTAPGVHEAFSQIWGTRRLWCSHDRVSINPPCIDAEILNDPLREARGVHWDNGQLRLAKSAADVGPLGFGVQGVLYLVDTPAENGAVRTHVAPSNPMTPIADTYMYFNRPN